MSERPMPIADFNMKGQLICPTCKVKIEIPHDALLGRGPGVCFNGHHFIITDKVAYAVNELIAKCEPDGERKQILKGFEESPSFIPESDKH